jgi:hypothetical protein
MIPMNTYRVHGEKKKNKQDKVFMLRNIWCLGLYPTPKPQVYTYRPLLGSISYCSWRAPYTHEYIPLIKEKGYYTYSLREALGILCLSL